MAQVTDKLWTLEEFLAFDDGSDTSYQLFEGRLVAMNSPLRGHSARSLVRLARHVWSSQLKPPCEAMWLKSGSPGQPVGTAGTRRT